MLSEKTVLLTNGGGDTYTDNNIKKDKPLEKKLDLALFSAKPCFILTYNDKFNSNINLRFSMLNSKILARYIYHV